MFTCGDLADVPAPSLNRMSRLPMSLLMFERLDNDPLLAVCKSVKNSHKYSGVQNTANI